MAGRSAIVGIYEYPHRVSPGLSALQIQSACAAVALEDAGLQWSDVDAICDPNDGGIPSKLSISEYLGLHPRWVDTTNIGGSSFECNVAHACQAISAGKARVVLISYGQTSRSDNRRIGTGPPPNYGAIHPASTMEAPWGMSLISNYALVAARHIWQYGTPQEAFAEISVASRVHALRNPHAVQGLQDLGIKNIGPLTIDDVIDSEMISDPIRRLDCCLITDGGGAVILAAEDVARDVRSKPVWVVGTGEAVAYPENGRDITITAAAQSGPEALREAGVDAGEIDIAMIYDSFTITVLTALEDIGFCPKGEVADFVARGRLRYDSGRKPALNTDGGGLSSNHPGMRGIFLLIEAVRQLRGASTAQVPDAKLALAHGNGGFLGTRHAGATVVLSAD